MTEKIETESQQEQSASQKNRELSVSRGAGFYFGVYDEMNAAANTKTQQPQPRWYHKISGWVREALGFLNEYSTLIIMLATLANFAVAYLQWSTMREETAANQTSAKAAEGQLMEMRSGSADTKTVAEAAGKTADAAQQNVATAQAALKATIENARIDKRAWVVVPAIWLMKLPIVKQQMRFIVEIQNVGETPGLKVVRRIQFSVSQPSNLGAFQNISDRSGSVVVPPGGGVYNSFFDVSEDEAPTEMQIAEVINGNSSLYLYGIVDYEDIFGSKHFTRFCGRYGIDRNLASPQFSVFPLLKFCENDDYNYME